MDQCRAAFEKFAETERSLSHLSLAWDCNKQRYVWANTLYAYRIWQAGYKAGNTESDTVTPPEFEDRLDDLIYDFEECVRVRERVPRGTPDKYEREARDEAREALYQFVINTAGRREALRDAAAKAIVAYGEFDRPPWKELAALAELLVEAGRDCARFGCAAPDQEECKRAGRCMDSVGLKIANSENAGRDG